MEYNGQLEHNTNSIKRDKGKIKWVNNIQTLSFIWKWVIIDILLMEASTTLFLFIEKINLVMQNQKYLLHKISHNPC